MTVEMIELTAEQFAALTKTARAVPSPYEENVRAAKLKEPKAVAIPTDDSLSSRTIVNNLHKAGKAVNKKLQVVVREKATPPMVIWQVIVDDTTKTADAPEATAPAAK